MMNDTVREELQTKITSGRLTPRIEVKTEPIAERVENPPAGDVNKPKGHMPVSSIATPPKKPQSVVPVPQTPTRIEPPTWATTARPPAKRGDTANLLTPKTSPTLVGFQNKNASLPDWRIQLQNAVQQRKGGQVADAVASQAANSDSQYPTNGGAALKVEVVPRSESPQIENEIKDPRVANAMRRIAESRNTFLAADKVQKKAPADPPIPLKTYPFDVVSASGIPTAASMPGRLNVAVKLVNPAPAPIAEKRDTNKLPQIELPSPTKIHIYETASERSESGQLPPEFAEIKRIRIKADTPELNQTEYLDDQSDEIEDLAQFSMRFGAGLFDFIIAGFTSFVLLSPIAFTMGQWFTTAGILAFAGVAALVMFIYMTACLGFYGKTLGMRLFSLELVDAVENEYPSLHQAAVSSSVYILSLVFGGAGFLTVFFNEEKRAAHDLLSGTILVREF